MDRSEASKHSVDMRPLKTGKYSPLNGDYGATSSLACRFQDGVSRIDMVLVYEITNNEQRDLDVYDSQCAKNGGDEDPVAPSKLPEGVSSSTMNLVKNRRQREKYLRNLKTAGLKMEVDTKYEKNSTIHFIKLNIPWSTMCRYAEDMKIRVPIQLNQTPRSDNYSAKVLHKLKIGNIMQQTVPRQPPDFNTAPFQLSKIDRCLRSEDHEQFFKDTDRALVAYEILMKTVYGKKKKAEIGIERLVQDKIFSAFYSLHDGPDITKTEPVEKMSQRQILREYWARWGCWYKYQPLDHVRNYMGEKIALYFAWLGFYTCWLLPATIVGTLITILSALFAPTMTYVREVCKPEHETTICPICSVCPFTKSSDNCFPTMLEAIFDNPGSFVMAVFMSLWAVTFLEYWKRTNVSLAYHWDVLGFEEEEEQPRPQYQALSPQLRENPITGHLEPHFPEEARRPRLFTSLSTVIVMVIIVFIFTIAVIVYRVIFTFIAASTGNPLITVNATTVGSMTSSVLNLILIMVLGVVYNQLAKTLTDWEMHRTQTEYEDSYIAKLFVFQFFNYYSSLFYIGFVKGKFSGTPGHYHRLLGVRMEQCNGGGCMYELAVQLLIIMVGKQFLNNFLEIAIPFLKGLLRKRKLGSDETPWERDYVLADFEGLIPEYLEMIIQYGFITIFVAAFPLAPAFAWINNLIEIRLDARKMIRETRRPIPQKGEDIGVWFRILDILAQVAVIANAFLIAFTSSYFPQVLYASKNNWSYEGYYEFSLAEAPANTTQQPCRYEGFFDPEGRRTQFYWELLAFRLIFVIVFEHVIFSVGRLIDLLIPDIPETLQIKIKREQYLAKQALAETDLVLE